MDIRIGVGHGACPRPQPANALQGTELARMCKAVSTLVDPNAVKPQDMAGAIAFSRDVGFCLGYLNGFNDGKSFATYKNGSLAERLACIPHDVTIGQLANVLVKASDESPAYAAVPAIAFAAGSFARAWPCPSP